MAQQPLTWPGIVGVGNMGLGMALRLLDCGHAVGVRDLVAEREHAARAHGATVCADAAAAAQGRDLLIVAVVDALQTEQVLFGERGAVHGLAPGSTVLLCPTLAPQTVEDCAARLAERGIDCIDAPMSGGPARARDGTMSLMVACADAVFERWQPLLRELSSAAVPHRHAGRATARAPSWSTTCWRPSTWPARPRRWRWRSGSAWTRRPRWR